MRSKLKVLVAVFLMAAMVFTMFPASAIAGPKGRGNRKPGKTVEETQAPETEVVETEAPTEEDETETVIETEPVETEAVETVQETEAPAETEAVLPAQTFEKEDEESGISVLAEVPEGALPADAEMVLTALTASQLADVEDKVDGNLVEAIDIAFWSNGEEIEPLIPIKVTMSSAKIAEVEDTTVVHIADVTGEVTEVEKIDEPAAAANEVVFEADSFSVYAVIAGCFLF